MSLASTRRTGSALKKALTRQADKQSEQEILQEKLRVALHQRDSFQRQLEAAQQEIDRLNAENDLLAAAVGLRAPSSTNGGSYVTWNGKTLVTQVQAAELLRVKVYTVSRWAAAGNFIMVDVPWRSKPLIDLSSVRRPQEGKRGRKSAKKSK